MLPKPTEHQKAIRMRQAGATYKEISQALKISKGTCSLWLKKLKLNQAAQKRIQDICSQSHVKANAILKTRRIARDQKIEKSAAKTLVKLNLNQATQKVLCAALYWAEGHKCDNVVSFTNSDPKMISAYLKLLHQGFNIKEEKLYAWLHLHEYHDIKKQKRYWSKITKIPTNKIKIYIKPNTGKNKKPGYPGCICIRYGSVEIAKEIAYLYTALVKRLGGVV